MLLKKVFNRLALYTRFVYKRIVYFITRPYYTIRTSWPVWYLILNKESRKLYQANPPKLTAMQQRLSSDLKKSGIAVGHLDELFPGQNMLPKLQARFSELRATPKPWTKSFLRGLYDVFPVIDLQDPFVRLAFAKPVLDVVNSYMEVYSKFRVLTLNITLPVGADAKAIKSQRWHRDPEDKRMCKFFLYLNDVDDQAGPFMYVPESHYGGKWRNVFPQRPPKGIYPPEGGVENSILPECRKAMTGKAGTIIFCDTSGLHKGGYAISKERWMFTAGYNSNASLWPIQYQHPANFNAEKIANLDPQAKYALDNKSTDHLVDQHAMN